MLVAAGAAATVTRYVAPAHLGLRPRAGGAHGGRGGLVLRPTNGGSTRGQGGARGRGHPGRRPRHRSRPRRAGRDGLRDRAQHARPALGGRPARDDRGDRRARHRARAAPAIARRASTTSISDEVRALVARIEAEQGRLDVLVNDVWGGEQLFEWDDAGVGARPRRRAAAAAPGDRDPPHHEPLRAAAADRAPRRAPGRGDRRDRRVQREHYRNSLFYDLAKTR